MGVDFRILCEYKQNNKWKLLQEDIGIGEFYISSKLYDDKIDYWKCG